MRQGGKNNRGKNRNRTTKPHEISSAISLLNCSQQNSRLWKILKTHMQAESTVTNPSIFCARQSLGLQHFSPPTHVLTGEAIKLHLVFSFLGKAQEKHTSSQGSQSQNRTCLGPDKSRGFSITSSSLSPFPEAFSTSAERPCHWGLIDTHPGWDLTASQKAEPREFQGPEHTKHSSCFPLTVS